MTTSTVQDKHYCFRCNRDIPLLHSSWEGINSSRKIHWFINYCPRCGTVTSVEQSSFYYGNLIPRIGKLKSFLFIFLLIGTPYHLVAWLLGGLGPGIGLSLLVLALAFLASRGKIHQVETCPYTNQSQYSELIRTTK